jgi:uncharacterized protein YyaL (SSP411 family)
MKNSVLLPCLLALLITGSALAQSEKNGDGDVANLVNDVTAIAELLQKRVASLGEQVAASSDAEAGTRAIEEMLAAARELQTSLGRDSKLWDEMNGMMDTWSAKRDDLLERAKKLPALKPVANGWQSRIDEGLHLRQKILAQAAESEALITQIEETRAVIIAYYDLDLADKALETMRLMSEELSTMNSAMSSILEQANVVAKPPSLAQE